MSTLTLIDDGFYMPKLLRPSVFSRVFLQLRGQMWQFHGPAVPQSRAAPHRRHHGVFPDSRVTNCVAETCLRLHHRHRVPGGGEAIQHTQGDGESERLPVQG